MPGSTATWSPALEEQAAAAVQFARFAGVCRPFAPIYRSGDGRAASRAALAGQDPAPIFDLAYGDVLAAWRHYLAAPQSRAGRSC